MNPGLRYLLAKGPAVLARRMGRRFSGGRGALMLVGIALLVVVLVAPQLFRYFELRAAGETREIAEMVRSLGPAAILLLVVGTAMRGGVYFRPAEIQFLFPAPISRRELLVYDALSKLRLQALSGLWLSVFILAYAELWYAAMAASVLVLAFWQLSAQAIGLLLEALEARFGKLARRSLTLAVAGLLLAGAAAAVNGAPPESGFVGVLERFASLPPVELLSSITRPLVEVYLAESFGALAFSAAVSIALLVAMLGLSLLFDVAYSEGALERAQKVARTVARMRAGGGAFAAGGASRGRIRVPPLPFWGGAGPMAWRQLQELARNYRGVLVIGFFMLLFVGAFVLAPSFFAAGSDRSIDVPVLIPLIAVAVMLPMMAMNFAFDFRRDLDRMAFLKSLPISGFALAAGQIIPTVLLLSAWELVGLAIVAIALGPVDPALLIGIVLALAPLNALLVALDNALFLLMPYRIVAKDPGQMPFMGRLMIVLFLKMLLVVILGGLAAIPATIVWHASGRSVSATALAVVAFLLACAVPMTYAVAAAFKAFDVSRDVPD